MWERTRPTPPRRPPARRSEERLPAAIKRGGCVAKGTTLTFAKRAGGVVVALADGAKLAEVTSPALAAAIMCARCLLLPPPPLLLLCCRCCGLSLQHSVFPCPASVRCLLGLHGPGMPLLRPATAARTCRLVAGRGEQSRAPQDVA